MLVEMAAYHEKGRTLLAMVADCLAAVVPERLRGSEVKAREEAGLVSWERFTWLLERGLHNSVILDEN
jgi:hypothetical protein